MNNKKEQVKRDVNHVVYPHTVSESIATDTVGKENLEKAFYINPTPNANYVVDDAGQYITTDIPTKNLQSGFVSVNNLTTEFPIYDWNCVQKNTEKATPPPYPLGSFEESLKDIHERYGGSKGLYEQLLEPKEELPKEKKKEKINKSEEVYLNYIELANTLAERDLINIHGLFDEIKMEEEYSKLLNNYKEIILKHERNTE